ncbi:M48 family metallopeptidase [Sphingomonas sp. CFBP 8760]|uniref:M48 family metallopeptidase n=1 Tax=Sphingomonas sp. CFBP 8760 TaxID=2775282 RepID=UPI00178627F1|nr:M48 family metallopeptidase [Sphingomonas sp. CFBP 8760]MBD8545978.1 M48 family metalloprotease [Sphingomonas sp. CFBP 8760]
MPRPIAVALLLAAAAPVPAPPAPAAAPTAAIDADGYRALRAIDLRLATIAHRLVTANARLCDRQQPAPGVVLHAIDQYDPDTRAVVRQVFGFVRPVSVEAVVPGGAADRAGLVADDGVVSINRRPMPAPRTGPKAGDATSATRDAAAAILAAAPTGPSPWVIDRAGATRTLTIDAPAGCRAAFEVLLGPAMAASSDGATVQIGVRFFERYTDEQVAAVVAHELAHTVLRHRARLEAAGVKWGLLSEFGRNGRLFRRTESEADLLGAGLMRNAGYDPAAAVAFWRDHGGDVDGGLFRSRTHPSSRARADAIAAEIATMPADRTVFYRPPLIATRDQPLN